LLVQQLVTGRALNEIPEGSIQHKVVRGDQESVEVLLDNEVHT